MKDSIIHFAALVLAMPYFLKIARLPDLPLSPEKRYQYSLWQFA
jgi:hypothetical protein